MKTTRILGAVMALAIAAAPALGFTNSFAKNTTSTGYQMSAQAAVVQGWVKYEERNARGQVIIRWRYRVGNVIIKNQWKQIDLKWYHFDKDGWMQTGWFKDPKDKKWYYLGADGAMFANQWLHDTDGKWYYLGADGAMYANGWYKINGVSHYFDKNGVWKKQK